MVPTYVLFYSQTAVLSIGIRDFFLCAMDFGYMDRMTINPFGLSKKGKVGRVHLLHPFLTNSHHNSCYLYGT